MKQVHILITGFVQGVGFRQMVKHEARKRNLTGWVKNLSDGSVEALAIGSEDKLAELIEACKKGPFLSQVDNVHVEWEAEQSSVQQEFVGFVVRHD